MRVARRWWCVWSVYGVFVVGGGPALSTPRADNGLPFHGGRTRRCFRQVRAPYPLPCHRPTDMHKFPCARSGAVEPIAAGLFAWLALSSQHDEQHALCGLLALVLLGLRLLWTAVLAAIA